MQPFGAFRSWFLRTECDNSCGKVFMRSVAGDYATSSRTCAMMDAAAYSVDAALRHADAAWKPKGPSVSEQLPHG